MDRKLLKHVPYNMGDALLGHKDVQYPTVEHGLNLPNRASQQ